MTGWDGVGQRSRTGCLDFAGKIGREKVMTEGRAANGQ